MARSCSWGSSSGSPDATVWSLPFWLGSPVPLDLPLEIRAIHQASVANLRAAVGAFERVRVYDSTTRWAPPRPVAAARGGRLVRQGATPGWLEAALANE